MKSALRIAVVIPALFASALFVGTPAFAESDGQAVAQCRAELLGRFEAGAVRSYRIAQIAGNARRTRVTFYVNADRRYTFECAAGANGEVLTASLNPPIETRLAAGAASAAQAQ